MRNLAISLAAALVTCTAFAETPHEALSPVRSVRVPSSLPYLAQIYWVPPRWHGYWGASTAAGSYAIGSAAMMRAAGEYNLLTAQARVAAAEAQRGELENRLRATEVYFQVREENRAYRAKLRGPRPTPEDLKRYAAAGRPDPLSPSELDTVTGRIFWPALLRDDCYADHRAKLEALFAARAASSELGTAAGLKIREATGAMLAELKKWVACVPQMDYIAAKRFIQSLAYEARQSAS